MCECVWVDGWVGRDTSQGGLLCHEAGKPSHHVHPPPNGWVCGLASLVWRRSEGRSEWKRPWLALLFSDALHPKPTPLQDQSEKKIPVANVLTFPEYVWKNSAGERGTERGWSQWRMPSFVIQIIFVWLHPTNLLFVRQMLSERQSTQQITFSLCQESTAHYQDLQKFEDMRQTLNINCYRFIEVEISCNTHTILYKHMDSHMDHRAFVQGILIYLYTHPLTPPHTCIFMHTLELSDTCTSTNTDTNTSTPGTWTSCLASMYSFYTGTARE